MTEVVVLFFSLSIPVLLLVTARICSVSLWVSPLLFMAIQVVIGVTAKGLLYVFQPSFSSRLDFGFEENYMLIAFLYISLFIIMFLGGYIWKSRGINRRDTFTAIREVGLTDRYLKLLLIGCFLITILTLFLLSIQKEQISGIGSLFQSETLQQLQRHRVVAISGVEGYGTTYSATSILFSFNTLAFCILLVQKYWGNNNTSRWSLTNAGIVLLSVLVVFEALITGSRNQVAGYLLLYMAIILGGPVKMAPGQIVRLISVLLLAMAVVSFMTNFRYGLAGIGSVGFGERVYDSILQPVFYSEYFLSITKLTVILSEVAERTMLWGQSLISWTYGLIPRPLWPDKPAISLGIYVKNVIYGLPGGLGGIPPTFPGELFINFSWFGLLLAPVYGFALRSFEVFCFRASNIRRWSTHWVYFLLLIPLSYNLMQNALSAVMITGIAQCFIALVVIYLTRGSRSRPSRSKSRHRDNAPAFRRSRSRAD